MNCPKCGAQIPDNATYCGYCNQPLQPAQQQPVYQQPMYQQPMEQPVYQQPMQQPMYQQPAKPQKKENIVLGLVGAVVGSLIGALCIILLGQINFVASISGLVLAVCTLKGYEMLGGKLSTVGIILCVILMLIIPYLANRVDWAIFIADELNVSFGDAFETVPDFVELDLLENYWSNLVMLYLFTILGGAATVGDKFKNRKK